jgi:hypothetical protein
MENQQVQQPAIDTRVKGATKKGKKREFKNRKTFSLKAMEALVDKVGFLKNKYEALSINAQEKLGYHYNEILNILLFHKYVKNNKKLFEIYKKVKDAINKGYEFSKKKKLKENKMKTMKNNNSSSHFAINKKTNKILESWNYEGYDHDELKKYKHEYFTKDVAVKYPFLNENDVVVVTSKNLEKKQLNENNKKDWQKYNYSHFALLKETNHILYGFDYSDVDSDELTKNKNKYFLNILAEEYNNEISPKDVVVVKSSKLSKLGIKDYLNESNWAGLINEAYCKSDTEKMIDEEMDENLIEYNIPEWAIPALINGDYSGLSDEDKKKIDSFTQRVVSEVGNANFMLGDMDGEDKLGFTRDNAIDNLGSNVYRLYVRKNSLQESTAMGGGAGGGVFGAEGMPVANPKMKGKKKGFDLKNGQNMFDKPSNDLGGMDDFYSRWTHPAFKKKKGSVKVDSKSGRVTPNTKTHYSGTNKKVKGVNENYDLVDLDALMNDEIVEYKKISTPSNVFKSPKIELIRENNRDSISDFILKHQGHELPEVYNKRQLDNLALKTLNEYYNRLVQRLGLLGEEKRPDALVRIDALKSQSQKDSNNYYKKDASNKTTTMLVQKGEGDGLVYDKDSLEKKDIPKYQYQSEHQQQYLKVRRGLEDVVPENNPNGEVDPVWEARKKELMSTQEVGAKAYDAAKKRIQYKKDNKLGTGRGRAVLNQETLPKVDKADELLKENSFTVINEGNILNQIQSFYIDDENRKKPVIFDSNNIIEMNKINENKLIGCKELTYKGLGQTLSEDFKNRVLNKKLLYSPNSKKVFLV